MLVDLPEWRPWKGTLGKWGRRRWGAAGGCSMNIDAQGFRGFCQISNRGSAGFLMEKAFGTPSALARRAQSLLP